MGNPYGPSAFRLVGEWSSVIMGIGLSFALGRSFGRMALEQNNQSPATDRRVIYDAKDTDYELGTRAVVFQDKVITPMSGPRWF